MTRINPPFPPVLALDIGNTRTKLGFIDIAHCTCIAATAFPTGEIASRLLPAVSNLAASLPSAPDKTAALSSVVKEAGAIAAQLLGATGFSLRHLTAAGPLPLTFTYTPPYTLGADRIANALYGVTRFPGEAIILISAGTAIVIDYVADDTFHGGAILPGIALQLESLHRSTDSLPAVSPDDRDIPPLPGGSTYDCILGGVLHGTSAAISGIISKYRTFAALREPHILATGGDWPRLAPLVDFKIIAVPDLTLIGTACIINLSCQ